MLALVCALSSSGLLPGLPGVRPAAPPAAAAAAASSRSRAAGIVMRPAPKVPYKYPGMETPMWIDVYNRMYRERIMFLSQPIDDNFANVIISVLLYLESEDANSPVAMYYNCYGGALKSGLALYDTMRTMPYDIQTVNMGISADIAAFLVAGGTPGKRYALPNARFCLTNPRLDPPRDNEGKPQMRPMQATEMQLEVEEVLRDKRRLIDGYSRFTGRSPELLQADFKRNFYLSASEAQQYGLIDSLLMSKRPEKAALKLDAKLGAFSTDQRFGDVKFEDKPAASDDDGGASTGAPPAQPL